MYPFDNKDDDFHFKRVLQCFLPLAMYPFGLKGCKKINFLTNAPFGRFSLAMYHSNHFFLKALFLRATSGESGPFQLRCAPTLRINFGILMKMKRFTKRSKNELKLQGKNRSKPIGKPTFGGSSWRLMLASSWLLNCHVARFRL